MTIEWWHWLALGLVFVAVEFAAGGFYIIFFGIAAIVISALDLLGITGPLWVELLLFLIFSAVFLLFVRSPLMRWLNLDREGVDVDSLVGETGVAKDELPPGEAGRVELRGTVWTARNNSRTDAIALGRRCVVVRVDRLTLVVEAEGAHS